MALTLTFDQAGAGIPAGVLDRARTDLVSTDAGSGRAYEVQIGVGGVPDGSTADVVLLDEPPSSNPLLTQDGTLVTLWHLAFDAGVWGPFRVRARLLTGGLVAESIVRRVSIRSPTLGMDYPALAERTDPNAMAVASAPSIRLSEMNEGGTNRAFVDFLRALIVQLEALAAGGGASAPLSSAAVISAAGLITAALDTQYYIASPGVIVQLPDFVPADDVGKQISFLVSARTEFRAPAGGLVFLGRGIAAPQASASFFLDANGVYTFRCFYSSSYPVLIYLLELRDVGTRQDTDCSTVILSVPSDAVLTVGLGGAFTLTASPTGTERIVYDVDAADAATFDPTQIGAAGNEYTAIMPFGSSKGIARLTRDNSETDWQLDCELPNPGPGALLGSSKAHYTSASGVIYAGRTWELNLTTRVLRLLRAPLEIYPLAGEPPLSGDGDKPLNVHGLSPALALVNKVNRCKVEGVGGPTLTLMMGDSSEPNVSIGERFALSCEGLSGLACAVNVDPSQTLTYPDGSIGSSSISVFLQMGTYIEWQLSDGGTWRLVSFIAGAAGA